MTFKLFKKQMSQKGQPRTRATSTHVVQPCSDLAVAPDLAKRSIWVHGDCVHAHQVAYHTIRCPPAQWRATRVGLAIQPRANATTNLGFITPMTNTVHVWSSRNRCARLGALAELLVLLVPQRKAKTQRPCTKLPRLSLLKR